MVNPSSPLAETHKPLWVSPISELEREVQNNRVSQTFKICISNSHDDQWQRKGRCLWRRDIQKIAVFRFKKFSAKKVRRWCLWFAWTSSLRNCSSLTCTIASEVCGMSVITPSVIISSIKYCSPFCCSLAIFATWFITGAKFVGPYNCTTFSVRWYASRTPSIPWQ